jgi:hypothetical protein
MNRLLGLYAEDDVIPRLQPNPDVTMEQMDWQAMSAAITVEAQQDTTLVFDWLYFPGWWATLDDSLVPVQPIAPQGFVGIEVPEGQHTIEVGFGPTALRLGAIIASVVFLPVLTLALILMPKRTWGRGGPDQPDAVLPVQAVIGAIALAGIAVLGLKALWIDNAQTPIKRPRFAESIEAGVETPVQATFNQEITLLGYDLAPRRVRSGSSAQLALYWQLTGNVASENYSSVIYLRDSAGNILQQIGSQHPSGLPATQWLPSLYVQERLSLMLPAGTPPGIYTLHAALYSPSNQRNTDAFDAAGQPTGVSIEIGTLEVIRPRRAARLDIPAHAQVIDETLNDALALEWSGALPETLEVGQPFTLTLAWRAESAPAETYHAQLLWLDDDSVKAETPAFSPAVGYPTAKWEAGDRWRGIHVLYAPGRLERGDYEVAVQLIDDSNNAAGEPIVIGETNITTPRRRFQLPDSATPSAALWETLIRLAGYDLPEERATSGDALNLTLYWQAETDVSESLTVFIHLVDEDGNIVAQQDQIPVRGARPTTGWAPGEVIEDEVQLFIPPDVPRGEYTIRIGWYNAVTNRRILLSDSSEFWALSEAISIR